MRVSRACQVPTLDSEVVDLRCCGSSRQHAAAAAAAAAAPAVQYSNAAGVLPARAASATNATRHLTTHSISERPNEQKEQNALPLHVATDQRCSTSTATVARWCTKLVCQPD
jgi:hypothetical protein